MFDSFLSGNCILREKMTADWKMSSHTGTQSKAARVPEGE